MGARRYAVIMFVNAPSLFIFLLFIALLYRRVRRLSDNNNNK
jgi:hypothetical protein